MNSKKIYSILPIIISVFVFIVLLIGTAYAYYSAEVQLNNVSNITSNLPVATTIYTNASNCILDFTTSAMSIANTNTNVSDSCYLEVTISGGKGAYCTYDVFVEEVGEDIYVPSPGVGTAPNTFEFTGQVSGEVNIPETSLTSLKNTKIISNKQIKVLSDGVPVTQRYELTEKWYNLDLSQDSHSKKVYSFKFSIDNMTC